MFDAVAYINEPRWHTMSLGLDRISELLNGLDDPQKRLCFVHVAGTNGKGSTCVCMASILQAAGYRTGLFTSPYIECFEERIRINGTPISPGELRAVTLRVRDVAETMADHPTEFELMTAVAFEYFAEQGCDVVVAEVGLGGRLDSTNCIDTVEVSLIAPISYDHCALLGDTLAQIATEKAGIIKDGVAVASAPQELAARQVLEETAKSHHAPIHFVDPSAVEGSNDSFSYKGVRDLSLSLRAGYQRYNAALALEGCFILRDRGWDVPDEAIRAGLAAAQWPGRFDLVHCAPDIIIDGAHNKHAIEHLVEELEDRYPLRRIIFCMGVMADKDYRSMLEMLAPHAKAFVCYAPPLDRALPAKKLAAQVCAVLAQQEPGEADHGCLVEPAASAAEAVAKVNALANEHDVVCFCGSLYGIASVKEALSVESLLQES